MYIVLSLQSESIEETLGMELCEILGFVWKKTTVKEECSRGMGGTDNI